MIFVGSLVLVAVSEDALRSSRGQRSAFELTCFLGFCCATLGVCGTNRYKVDEISVEAHCGGAAPAATDHRDPSGHKQRGAAGQWALASAAMPLMTAAPWEWRCRQLNGLHRGLEGRSLPLRGGLWGIAWGLQRRLGFFTLGFCTAAHGGSTDGQAEQQGVQ